MGFFDFIGDAVNTVADTIIDVVNPTDSTSQVKLKTPPAGSGGTIPAHKSDNFAPTTVPLEDPEAVAAAAAKAARSLYTGQAPTSAKKKGLSGTILTGGLGVTTAYDTTLGKKTLLGQ